MRQPLSLLYIVLLASAIQADDRPLSPLAASKAMTLPEGFSATLFAGEPDIVQPIAFTFDDRGRMWVVECLSYPNWTEDGTGHDRVTILEDTNGDGVHDKKTIFLDDGSNLSGIELGFGGVWLCSLPNLIFIPDADKDDVPDGPPVILLDGWNLKETKHNVINALGWGPDGWLYGCNGIQARSWVGKPGTPKEQRTYMDCGVWRYHPTEKTFEVVATGTTNPFGLDWDQYGEMFITNCVIDHLWHFIPGGRYQRMYGEEPHPYTYELMGPASDHKHWGGGEWTTSRANNGEVKEIHSVAGGGHAHSGCCIYQGTNFPKEYRGSVFMSNIHGNRLNRDTLHRTKDGYVGEHAPDFMLANDPWFRGICVKQGPEGALYVSDWCDTGECHNYQVVDATNGRIHRISYKGVQQFKGNVSEIKTSELMKLISSENEWLARKARRVLQERAHDLEIRGDQFKKLERVLTGKSKGATDNKLRVLWLLLSTGQLTDTTCHDLIEEADTITAAWAVTSSNTIVAGAIDDRKVSNKRLGEEIDTYMLQCFASKLQNSDAPFVDLLKLLSLVNNEMPHNLQLLTWYAAGDYVTNHPDHASVLISSSQSNLVQKYIIRQIFEMNYQPMTTDFNWLTQTSEDNVEFHQIALQGIIEAMQGQKQLKVPDHWNEVYSYYKNSGDDQLVRLAKRLAVILGDQSVIDALLNQVADPKTDTKIRIENLQLLAPQQQRQISELWLKGMFDDVETRPIVIRQLGGTMTMPMATRLIGLYPKLTATERQDAIAALTTRSTFADVLLDAITTKKIPREDVTIFTARQITTLNDKSLSAKLEKVWGTIRPASATRVEQAKRIRTMLAREWEQPADLQHGRALFANNCASCHRMYDTGEKVGPELTGSQRANLDYLLENVLDPSAVVPKEYKLVTFSLLDGRTINGIITGETAHAKNLRTLNAALIIAKSDIESESQSQLSIMPDGLLDPLTDDEIRDLFAYLASKEQVPLPSVDDGPSSQ